MAKNMAKIEKSPTRVGIARHFGHKKKKPMLSSLPTDQHGFQRIDLT